MKISESRERSMDDNEARVFAAELGNPPEVDLHGLEDVNQGVQVLDQFLHQQFMAGSEEVRIIHGRGSGRMRQAVHTLLSSHELIPFFRDSYKPGEVQGVTYAALAKRF